MWPNVCCRRGVAARSAFRRAAFVTACSADLARRAVALGANPERMMVIPYGVDAERFRPGRRRQSRISRADWVFPLMRPHRCRRASRPQEGFRVPDRRGRHDCPPRSSWQLRATGRCARNCACGLPPTASANASAFLAIGHRMMSRRCLRRQMLIVAPSVRDEAGNVDGLPNVVMEALASGTPLITTLAGGIGAVVEHDRPR